MEVLLFDMDRVVELLFDNEELVFFTMEGLLFNIDGLMFFDIERLALEMEMSLDIR